MVAVGVASYDDGGEVRGGVVVEAASIVSGCEGKEISAHPFSQNGCVFGDRWGYRFKLRGKCQLANITVERIYRARGDTVDLG